jgi:hypothetical protein
VGGSLPWCARPSDGYAFTTPEYGIQPPILRIDATSFKVATQADILHPVGYPNGIVYDGSDLWIIQWNALELVRADPTTLEVRGRVDLGQDPNDPDGAFGEFYGYGYLDPASNTSEIASRSAADVASDFSTCGWSDVT